MQDPALKAIVQKSTPLFYSEGANQTLDRSAHVRAGSSLSCDLAWDELAAYLQEPHKKPVPQLQQICQYELGTLEDLRLTFTDATVTKQNVIFSATAENSPDASSDGMVAGSVLGILDTEARWIELRTLDGSLFTSKVEGVCVSRKNVNRL